MKKQRLLACVVCIACFVGALRASAADPATVSLAGDWKVSVSVDGSAAVALDVPPVDLVKVTAEKYDALRDFNPKAWGGWQKGVALVGVRAAECAVKGALDPASLVVREGAEATSMTFEKGKDYDADLDWGSVGRLPTGRIKADQPVFISYSYATMRIDSIVRGADGTISLKKGDPHIANPQLPALADGETRLANVFLSGCLTKLGEDNLYPILETAYPEPATSSRSVAEKLLPKTMQKLRSGEPLKILAWGDSVTTYNRWQSMFVAKLKAKYPNAKIELVTEAWGGRNTDNYLAEPPGSAHNYKEKVLDPKPDLIISEFVNDSIRNEQQVEERYSKLQADFEGIGAEWVILSPHYIRPDWMGLKGQKDIDDDPRPYVKGLRIFCLQHGVPLGDGSLRYGRLWRQGIPYLTLMENNINHPNEFGHTLFSDSLIALFQ